MDHSLSQLQPALAGLLEEPGLSYVFYILPEPKYLQLNMGDPQLGHPFIPRILFQI